jgi:predicted RNA-binding Zn-ribbon protein involved in translation (DUF1610 family)
MKFGFRVPSFKKRLAARTSLKRIVRHRMVLKMPSGMGALINPKRALYNKVYSKTTIGVDDLVKPKKRAKPSKQIQTKKETLDGKRITTQRKEDGSIDCPVCGNNMGQPITRGLIFKRTLYACPSCGTTAEITGR